jgi:hypothetical protein
VRTSSDAFLDGASLPLQVAVQANSTGRSFTTRARVARAGLMVARFWRRRRANPLESQPRWAAAAPPSDAPRRRLSEPWLKSGYCDTLT